MEVSGAAPDWALVRELAPLLCCRMAWTTQIGQRLGPFRGGQGLAGGCDCVPDAMPMQCTMHCQLIWPGRRTKRAPPSPSLFWVLFWVLTLATCGLWSHLACLAVSTAACSQCTYCRHAPYYSVWMDRGQVFFRMQRSRPTSSVSFSRAGDGHAFGILHAAFCTLPLPSRDGHLCCTT